MTKYIIKAAVDEGWHIGRGGKLPWRHKHEMLDFLQTVGTNDVLMGRVTYEGLNIPIANGKNYVLTSDKSKVTREGFIAVESIEEYETISNSKVCYVCGGSKVYRMFMENVQEMDVTIILSHIRALYSGDEYFPYDLLMNFECVSTPLYRYPDTLEPLWKLMEYKMR